MLGLELVMTQGHAVVFLRRGGTTDAKRVAVSNAKEMKNFIPDPIRDGQMFQNGSMVRKLLKGRIRHSGDQVISSR